ncbi:hypothetical protein AQUCO_00900890v1 [Aquilegia coerulea]|uniref:Uncharacterized protein n=1 Tax=Aquilegia coerulea TaxID=218851 RepID=A0A2G5EFV1_AQUCA|nr:hypothetical protein AQUCO_00900890v1 [Aquilegia coerulea]
MSIMSTCQKILNPQAPRALQTISTPVHPFPNIPLVTPSWQVTFDFNYHNDTVRGILAASFSHQKAHRPLNTSCPVIINPSHCSDKTYLE